jgi:hypothetical protein
VNGRRVFIPQEQAPVFVEKLYSALVDMYALVISSGDREESERQAREILARVDYMIDLFEKP